MQTAELTHERTGLADAWDAAPAPSPVPRRRARVSERWLVLVLAFAGYVTLSAYLILVRHAMVGDALARVANAQYVVDSRDPHLAAIGFVWNPLPSLLLLPVIPLRALWPAAVSTGFVGGVEGALFMAAAVGQLRGALQDLGVSRVPRLLLTVCFALHPMVVVYGYNGMSEAPLLFFTLLAARSLVRWVEHRTTRPLVLTGVALGLGYLTRYEAMASGAAAIALVLLLTLVRTRGSWRDRRAAALTDAAVVGLPFLMAFGLWAVVSKVIVGQWFPTLSSEYGNTAQVEANRSGIEAVIGSTTGARAHYVGHQLLGLEPLLLVVLAIALVVAVARRRPAVLATLAVVGAVLAFDVLASVTGRSFAWLRFDIVAIPLAVLLCGHAVAGLRRPVLRVGAGLVAVALVAPGLVTAVDTLRDPRLAREESTLLMALRHGDRATPAERDALHRWDVAAQIARDIRRLPRGAVLTDAANSFAVLLATDEPRRYVITPDKDFQAITADPVTFGVRYVLVPEPGTAADAVNTAYPRLYADGWPGGHLLRSWKGTGGPDWRLYELPTAAP